MATGIITKDSKKIRWKGVSDGAKIDTHALDVIFTLYYFHSFIIKHLIIGTKTIERRRD